MRQILALILATLTLSAHAVTLGATSCATAGANITCDNVPNDSGQTLEISRITHPQQYIGGGYPNIPAYTAVEVILGGVSYVSAPNAYSQTGPHVGVQTLSAVVTDPNTGATLQLNAQIYVTYTICSGRGCVSRQLWALRGGSLQ